MIYGHDVSHSFTEQPARTQLELGDQVPMAQIDGPKQGHGLPRGRVEQDGIRVLGRDPHHAAGAVLLEVAFVQAPAIQAVIAREAAEFFYMRPAPRGPLAR